MRFVMRLTQRQFMIFTGILLSYFVLFALISNLYLNMYEMQQKYNHLHEQKTALHSFFNKFTNISFPIAYSLNFYENYTEMETIYIITPTYNRTTQMADLTRLVNTLWLVPKTFWIMVEDSNEPSERINRFLATSKLNHVHLNTETPPDLKIQPGEKSWSKPRGVYQRNKALQWLRDHSSELRRGVVYFADDDNTYDIRLFEEMRTTKKVSVWPVGLSGELRYERPICRNGKVVDWFVVWARKRPFPMDMAGFAVSLNLILAHPSATFSHLVQRGMQESHFLSHLVRVKDLEARADNCTKILVWHTNTKAPMLGSEKLLEQEKLSYDADIVSQV